MSPTGSLTIKKPKTALSPYRFLPHNHINANLSCFCTLVFYRRKAFYFSVTSEGSTNTQHVHSPLGYITHILYNQFRNISFFCCHNERTVLIICSYDQNCLSWQCMWKSEKAQVNQFIGVTATVIVYALVILLKRHGSLHSTACSVRSMNSSLCMIHGCKCPSTGSGLGWREQVV